MNGDAEKRRHLADFAGQVCLQVGEMNKPHVRQISNVPPCPDIFPERPVRITVLFNPFAEIWHDLTLRRLKRRTNAPGRIVDGLIVCGIGIGVVIVKTPDHIASIPADVEVFGFGRKDEGIDGQMGFQKSPVRLLLDLGQLDVLRRYPQIEPRRHIGGWQTFLTVKQKLADDLLGPGRARLGVGADNDVVIAECVVVPDRRVEMVAVVLAGFFRPIRFRRGHFDVFPRCLHAGAPAPCLRRRTLGRPRLCTNPPKVLGPGSKCVAGAAGISLAILAAESSRLNSPSSRRRLMAEPCCAWTRRC